MVVEELKQSCLPPLLIPSFSGNFGGGVISLGTGNDNVTFSGAAVTGTTINGTGDRHD